MDDRDLAGAIWLPGDGRANPTDLTAALARGARDAAAWCASAPGSPGS
jgi:glycine/D-amino acid oxidase-like deaminating enzyme